MTLEELLSHKEYHYSRIHQFVAVKGIHNVTTEDLNKIIDKYGHDVLGIVDFFNLYNIVSTNEANQTMRKWTVTTGVLTIVVTVATVINLILFASTL